MSFIGQITLQENSLMDYSFEIKAATTPTANNGYIPYGRTITDIIINGYNSSGDVVTEELIDEYQIANNIVSVRLKYPGTEGRYKLEFIFTLDNQTTDEIEFFNIQAVDK